MRDWNEFSAKEWLVAKPVVAAFKEVRDAAIRDLYCARRTPDLEPFLSANANLRGGVVAITIAFQQPWLIEALIKRFARCSRDARLIVCDNSRTKAARIEIRKLCEQASVPYIGLPPNPVRNINRSHGNALNWVYRNVIVRLRPKTFGFVDHDLFPTAPFSFENILGDQPVYGVKRDHSFGWALWAGFCIFDFSTVEACRPDFNPDMDRKLVTGGRNYRRIYRHLDASKLRFATRESRFFDNPVPGEKPIRCEFMDDWLHIGGSSYVSRKMQARDFYRDLIENL